MALTPRRASVLLLLVALALVAIVFSSADAARAPKALEPAGQEAAAVADGRQAQLAPTAGSDDAVPVERVVVVVDKRGGGRGGGRGFGGGGGYGEGGEGEGSGGFGSSGYHGHGSGRGPKQSSASSGRDGVWKIGVAASVLGAAAWLL